MLLRHILAQLDAELDRLTSLRTIVVSLADTPIISAKFTPEPKQQLKVEPERRTRPPKVCAVPEPSGHSVEVPAAPIPTALVKVAHSGPVVVSAQALAEERERRAALRITQEKKGGEVHVRELSPDVLARDLAARWLTSAIQ